MRCISRGEADAFRAFDKGTHFARRSVAFRAFDKEAKQSIDEAKDCFVTFDEAQPWFASFDEAKLRLVASDKRADARNAFVQA